MKTLKRIIELGINNGSDQEAFVIIKPGFLHFSKHIIEEFEENGWRLSQIKTKQLLLSEAKKLYKPHKKEDFYESLCKYMSSGQSTAMIFTKNCPKSDEVFKQVNKIKDKIRDKYSESDMRNVMHSSDSLERLKIEAGIYF